MTEVLARATVTCHQRFYYLTGVDTVTQANEWSQLRTVEMTLEEVLDWRGRHAKLERLLA